MKTIRLSLAFMIVCSFLAGSTLVTARGRSAVATGAHDASTATLRALARAHDSRPLAHGVRASGRGASDLSPLTLRELAQARRATARYHDIANAEADGYVNGNLHTPGEGHHYINPLLVDGHFDPAQPEVLLYSARPGETGLRLVAVEYIVPNSFPVPEGFTGDDDVWQSEEPFPIWVLNAWIWLNNPDGIFTFLNPRVP